MARENVEIAERAMDAFNRVDIELFITLTTKDFEWSPSMVAIEGQIFRGSEGIRAYFASLSDAWKEFLIIPGTFRDVGDAVIMLGGLRGRGQNSDVTVDSSLGMVFDLRGRKISRIRGFLDHAEALRAARSSRVDGGIQLLCWRAVRHLYRVTEQLSKRRNARNP